MKFINVRTGVLLEPKNAMVAEQLEKSLDYRRLEKPAENEGKEPEGEQKNEGKEPPKRGKTTE